MHEHHRRRPAGAPSTATDFVGRPEDLDRAATPAETLVVIPNKTVAAEVITNFTRMPQRRVDETLGLRYDNALDSVQLFIASE